MAQRPVSGFIERRIKHFCGRWLDGFTQDDIEVSLLQANVTLSNVYFKTDELCLLSPTFSPKMVFVGKMSVHIPLGFNLSRPVRITVSDVMVIAKVGADHLSPEEARKAVSASVHVRKILGELASDLSGGEEGEEEKEEGSSANGGVGRRGKTTVTMGVVAAIQKVVQKIEITVKNAHVRLEETLDAETKTKTKTKTNGGEAEPPTSTFPPTPEDIISSGAAEPTPVSGKTVVAFGLTVREISLEPDARAAYDDAMDTQGAEAGQSRPINRWIGQKCRELEKAVLRSDARPVGKGDTGVSEEHSEETDRSRQPTAARATPGTTWGISKFLSIRGLSAYFCRDEECYTHTDRDETKRRMRERSRVLPAMLPPLLRRWQAGLGVKMAMSAEELGKIESIDFRFVGGKLNIQVTDDHLEYLLRWVSLLRDQSRALAMVATRPAEASVHWRCDPMLVWRECARRKSRYYRALWKHVKDLVLRDVKESVKWRGEEALQQRFDGSRPGETEYFTREFDAEGSAYRRARGALWRVWFGEWVSAARYRSARELMHPYLVLSTFSDGSGGTHQHLFEDLAIKTKTCAKAGDNGRKSRPQRKRGKSSNRHPKERQRLAKWLMPWQLPQEDVDKAWGLIRRKCTRWERRHEGRTWLALDEERVDERCLDQAVLQALWSIQLEMDAHLPREICAATRRMAAVRVELRSRTDDLWQARAAKQRRLGLDQLDTLTSTTRGSLSHVEGGGEESGGQAASNGFGGGVEALGMEEGGGGDGADRVGTLLVRMGRLDGVEGVGLFNPNAVATLMLEESSASVEEMEMEKACTKVAKYNGKSKRCTWNQTFRLQVELEEGQVLELRKRRSRGKSYRSSSSPQKDNQSTLGDDRSSSVAGNTPQKDTFNGYSNGLPLDKDSNPMTYVNLGEDDTGRTERATSLRYDISPLKDDLGSRPGRSDSMDSLCSTWSQAPEARPTSSFLLSVSCMDKGVFGSTHLGTVTLPSKELTTVALKVVEHKCTLFSAAASVGGRLLELTLDTVYVPPGEDVAFGEQELDGIEKRRRTLERKTSRRLEFDLPPSSNPVMRKGKSWGGRGREPLPPSSPTRLRKVDTIGQHEFKVLSIQDEEEHGDAATSHGNTSVDMNNNKNNGANGFPADNSQHKQRPASSTSIPIVDPLFPSKVALTVRLAGVKALAYLNYSAAVARGGKTAGGEQVPEQDLLVTLGEMKTSGVEAFFEMDMLHGKVCANVQAAVAELIDSSLLRPDCSSPGQGQQRDIDDASLAQVVRVGPVGIQVRGTCHTKTGGDESTTSSRLDGNDDDNSALGMGDASWASPTPIVDKKPSLDETANEEGEARKRFQKAWGSSTRWNWGGRLRLGAHRAELGDWPEKTLSEEVWKRLAFVLPSRPSLGCLDGTRVLRHDSRVETPGVAEGSYWLVKAGGRRLSVDVQMPAGGATDVQRAASSVPYVYISSSEGSTGTPTDAGKRDNFFAISTSPATSPVHHRRRSAGRGKPASGQRRRQPRGVMKEIPLSDPSYASDTDQDPEPDSGSTTSTNSTSGSHGGSTKSRRGKKEKEGKQETGTDMNEVGREQQGMDKSDELRRRIKELEQEVLGLREAAATIAAGAAALAAGAELPTESSIT